MGILLSRFRRKKTTIEVLDELDKKIKMIQEYGQNTEQRHKKIVGTLIIYSVALYIITAVIFYFYFFPAELYDQIFYITPLLIFPILILSTKNMVTWYYRRKISRNEKKLIVMQEEKKKILDEVTETETYKKAKEILMKFAPDQLRLTPLSPQNVNKQSPTTPETLKSSKATIPSLQDGYELRRRVLAPSILSSIPPRIGTNMIGPAQISQPSTPSRASESPLPRPVLPQQRSYIDRLVEYVVGDGPNNRYALICRQCDSHNGMALREEFEYFAFRCCYCNFWNPARKQKPSAPKLEFDNTLTSPKRLCLQPSHSVGDLLQTKMNEIENSNSLSDTDSDIEVVEKSSITPDSEENNIAMGRENEDAAESTLEAVSKAEKVENEKME